MVDRTTPEEHHGINCDNCGMYPILGHRFRCINCRDFDLCSSCEELNPHDSNHTFLKIRIAILGAIETFPFIPAPLSQHHPGPSAGIGTDMNPPLTSQQQQRRQILQPRFHQLGPSAPLDRGLSLSLPQLRGRLDPPSPTFIDTVNQFGFKLQYLLAREKCSNGVAAANIYRCLMMAAQGSQGLSLEAFAKMLGFDASSDALADTVQNIVQLDGYCKPDLSNGGGGDVELAIGSSVWPGRLIEIRPAWAEIMTGVFEATYAPQEARAMNAWVSERTQGKIQSVIGEGDISAEDIKLVTCLYFKAKWEVPFDNYNTWPGLFFGFDDENGVWKSPGKLKVEMRCKFMHQTSDILYWEDNVAQVCVLPYQTKNTKKNKPEPSPFLSAPSAFAASAASTTFSNDNDNKKNDSAVEPTWNVAIILPKTPGADAILSILSHFSTSPSTLRALLNINHPGTNNPASSNLKSTYLHLALPRFTLKQSTDISELLFSQGLRPISRPSTDFRPMTLSQDAYISSIKHDLIVEVNEEGTEVAAATTMGVFGGAKPPARDPVEMRVERPFLFLVFDSRSGSVLCSAVVSEVGKC